MFEPNLSRPVEQRVDGSEPHRVHLCAPSARPLADHGGVKLRTMTSVRRHLPGGHAPVPG
jgi:hypothetical protein